MISLRCFVKVMLVLSRHSFTQVGTVVGFAHEGNVVLTCDIFVCLMNKRRLKKMFRVGFVREENVVLF